MLWVTDITQMIRFFFTFISLEGYWWSFILNDEKIYISMKNTNRIYFAKTQIQQKTTVANVTNDWSTDSNTNEINRKNNNNRYLPK